MSTEKPIPTKLPLPPAQADMLDVVYAEGWNACCDTYFGGLPAQEPVVITITEKSEPSRTLTVRELADLTAPWSRVWTDQSFGIANAAIAKFCEVNNINTIANYEYKPESNS